MAESIFGSPSYLLIAESVPESVPESAPQTGNGVRMPASVHQPPPSFTDVQFGTIGKPPNLLSRISAPDPATLHLPSQLAERIQMNPSQLSTLVKSQNLHPIREPPHAPRINRNRYVLPTTSESNMSQMQAPANAAANKVRETLTPELVYPGSFLATPTTEQFDRDVSSSSSSNPFGSPKPHSSAGFFPQPTQTSLPPNSKTTGTSSSQVPDIQVAHDSLSALYVRLLEKNKALSPTLPTSHLRTPSPFLPAGLRNETNVEELSAISKMLAADGNALAPTSSQSSNMPSLVEAAKKLQSAAEDVIQLQLGANEVFKTEHMDFDARRKAFEEHMLVKEAGYNVQMQTLQKQWEDLRTREERLVALEEESRLREETRRARDAQRRARDDQRKFEDESKRRAIQEEIAGTMKLLEEVQAEKTKWEAEKRRAEREKTLVPNHAVPLQLSGDIGPCVEKEDDMTEEEIKVVDDHNKSLDYQRQLTKDLKEQITWTQQSFHTLQHMKETRLQVAEAERRLVEEEAERQRVHAEEVAKRAAVEQEEVERQRVQAEAAEKRGDEEQELQRRELLGLQSAHVKAQSQNVQVDTQTEYSRRRTQVLANNQQATSEKAARIRAERAGHLLVSMTDGDNLEDTNVEIEVDELASPPEHTVPLPGQKGITPKKPASRIKKTSRSLGTSGNVMLGAPSTSNGLSSSSMSTPTSSSTASASYKTPSFVSASTDVGRQVITDAPLFSTQMASEFSLHLSVSPPPNGPLPTSKKIALPSTPKSRTILGSDSNEWTEWTVSQQVNLSPAQRDANLRHIKKNRHRVEKSAAGDRSVKRPDDSLTIKTIKTEEVVVEQSHDQEQASSLPEEGAAARSTDAIFHIPNVNPSSKISHTNASQTNDIPQTSVGLVISQAPSASLRSDARVGSAETSRCVTGIAPIRNSPDPWVMDASVSRQEICSRYDPNQRSRQNSEISGRARSPEPSGFTRSNGTSNESRQRQRRAPRYSDHYSPPPTSATSPHHRHLQNETRAYGLPIPPRQMSPMNSGKKRPAEHDNEDDTRDRRRLRGDHYVVERDCRNPRGLARCSPATETEWRRGRSTSLEPRSSTYNRLRSPSPSRQVRPHIERDTLDRRGRNEGTYKPDYTNAADVRRPQDSGYGMEERPTRREERDPRGDEPSLLGRISTPGGRGNTNRGWGRSKGNIGRGRGGVGGRGRPQQPLPPRPLEERIAK
ncbi:hypothetical protein BDR07DRAFT_1396560 [Suillus spraguei]|nr:hypothetical protein BDR07DRAFT_1396560 [Suillus spraguei]